MTINLGNIVTIGGRTVGVGISSNLDTETIVKDLVAARRIPAVSLEDQIEVNSSKTTALSELRSILTSLQTAADFLRKPPGFNSAASNTFEFRSATLSTNSSSDADSFLTVDADPGALLGQYDIAVGQIATARSYRSASFTSKTDDVTEAASGAIRTVAFGSNAPAIGDTLTIGGSVFTFVANGTTSNGANIELGTTITGTLANIVSHLSSEDGQDVGADVGKFDYTRSGSTLTITSRTVGSADNGVAVSASILAGAPTINSTNGVAGATSGSFSAGSFQISPTSATAVTATTASTNKLATSEYTVAGSATGTVITSAGIQNITASGGEGDLQLRGTIASFSGTYNAGPTNTLVITATVNGLTYTSNSISTAAGGSGQAIASGQTITFTSSTGDSSFQIVTGASDYNISQSSTNAGNFVDEIEAAVASQTIYQDRELGNFNFNVRGSTAVGGLLDGLESKHVKLRSDGFDSDGEHGDFEGFTVTHEGVDDNTISVIIDGETYTATGLLDNHTANITLTNTDDSNRKLYLNINTAGVALDLSNTSAASAVEAALDRAFGTRALTDITISSGDSLVDIAAAVNAKTATTGVSASIIQVSSTDFRIVLQAEDVGIDNSFAIIDDNDVIGDVTFTDAQTAQDAIIAVNGIVIERSSNNIDDVIDGLTFNLNNVTDAFTTQTAFDALVNPDIVTAEIEKDTDTAKAGILNFINAYNAFRVFADEQTARDESTGAFLETAVLGNNTTLGVFIQQFSDEITSIVGGVSNSNFKALSNIGITVVDFEGDAETPETTNILTVDEDVLDEALASNYANIREIFEFSFTSSSSDLSIFSRTNALTLTSFQLQIDTSADEGEEVQLLDENGSAILDDEGDPIYLTLDGTTIRGQDGTPVEGLVLIYTGSGSETIDVSVSQGVGDRFYNFLEGILDDDGTLDLAVDDIADEDERLQDEIDDIDAQIETYRETLLTQFSALEEAISRVNTLLSFLDVSSQAFFNSDS